MDSGDGVNHLIYAGDPEMSRSENLLRETATSFVVAGDPRR
jgi:hypothetical protein